MRLKGRSLPDYVGLPVSEALQVFEAMSSPSARRSSPAASCKEIRERLRFLDDVGVGYLTLGRSAATLSGGEGAAHPPGHADRLEPHRRALRARRAVDRAAPARQPPAARARCARLRDLGNTVIVVEHDEETIRMADYVVDLGPGAGEHGGRVMFQGTPAQLAETRRVADRAVPAAAAQGHPRAARAPAQPGKAEIVIKGARANNLKDIDVRIPLGVFVAVTGVSGSGKSTLVNDILYKALAKQIYRSTDEPGPHKVVDGVHQIDKVIEIDQSPIGRTPRSNPATYTGLFSFIRDLFAMVPEAKARGYRPGRFSFNVKGGRCEACQGDGVIAIEMHFLPDVFVTCEQCKGRRYNRETLDVKYRGKSIAEVLDLTVSQALPLLENFPLIANKLRTLESVGLGYVTLGQSATTLSGGEAQRVKLARELSKRGTGTHALHPRRTHDRPALRRRPQAARRAQPAGRPGQHGAGHRAQPRRHPLGRLGD